MKEFLLVDGYNIINAWGQLKGEMQDISLGSAREKLLDILANYQGYRKINTIVVFDAHYVKNSMEKHEYYNDVEVVFTKEFESADSYIERTIANMDREDTIRVVTADFSEQLQILGYGAIRVTIGEFVEEIRSLNLSSTQKPRGSRMIGKNRLETLLDDKTRNILETWRLEGQRP